jgi:adenylosuccinate synthase
MINGKMNVILDSQHGSSGKGKISSYLADKFGCLNVSSANYPNAGHSLVYGDFKFVAKALPTALGLKRAVGLDMAGYVSPGSGFSIHQLAKEWKECAFPRLYIHDRAMIVTDDHARREREGSDSTKHIASTMQGSGSALSDKIMRRPGVTTVRSMASELFSAVSSICDHDESLLERIHILDPMEFRNVTHSFLEFGSGPWLHEGSQGYALSIDHGSHYPESTSRNCNVQTAMDYMAVPPGFIGDVYMNVRTFPIRVGNVVEEGIQKGYSGDFYPDQQETTWEEIARNAGMPPDIASTLCERERTTVTKRIRRTASLSIQGLKDAVRVNGATKLCVNFIQYLDWNDNGLKGGRSELKLLSKKSRSFIDMVESETNVPVVLIGTGASHDEIIDLMLLMNLRNITHSIFQSI